MLTKQLEFVKERKLPSPAGTYKRKDNRLARMPTQRFQSSPTEKPRSRKTSTDQISNPLEKKKKRKVIIRSHTHCNKQHEPTQCLAWGCWCKICTGLHHSARSCQQEQVVHSRLRGMTAAPPAQRNALYGH